MVKEKMTLEKLAKMTKDGFDEVGADFKKEINDFRTEANNRFDRIENILITAHENRMDRIDDRLRKVETTLEK